MNSLSRLHSYLFCLKSRKSNSVNQVCRDVGLSMLKKVTQPDALMLSVTTGPGHSCMKIHLFDTPLSLSQARPQLQLKHRALDVMGSGPGSGMAASYLPKFTTMVNYRKTS